MTKFLCIAFWLLGIILFIRFSFVIRLLALTVELSVFRDV